MVSLLRLILILLIIYLIYRLLVRYIIPILFKSYIRRSQERFYQQNPELKKQKQKKEGEVSVDYVPDNKEKDKNDQYGEYIDYEDVS